MSYIVFTGLDGEPLENGMIYIGEAPDARDNPISVYWDEELTIPAAQPIRTTGGYPTYQGNASNLFIDQAECLVTVLTSNGETVFSNAEGFPFVTIYDLASTESGKGADMVGYSVPGIPGVTQTVGDKLREVVSILDFPDIEPNNASFDNGPGFQAAFNYCIANNVGRLVVPVGNYRFETRAVYSSERSFRLEGLGPSPVRATSSPCAAIQWAGADGSGPFVFQTDGTSVANACNGIEVTNMLIYRSAAETSATDGAGLILRGVYGGAITGLTISGFSTGLLTDDNPSNAGGNPVRCGKILFSNLEIKQAARYRMRLRGTCQCVGLHLSLLEESAGAYIADLQIEPGTNAGRSDGNQFFGGAFIGADDTADRPDYNIQLIDSIFNAFFGTAIERSNVAGVNVVNNNHTYTPNSITASFVGCWWDGHAGFAADAQRARVEVIAPRCGAHTGTGAAFRFVGDPDGLTAPQIGGGIRGGVIEFKGTYGVQIVDATGVTIDGLEGSDIDASDAPLVFVEANCVNTSLMNLHPHADTTAYADNGTDTFISTRTATQTDLIRFDPDYYIQLQAGNPVFSFAANDYLSYDRTANEYQFFIAGNLVAKLAAASTQIMANSTIKTVQVGDADSGGAGYRMLRVSN